MPKYGLCSPFPQLQFKATIGAAPAHRVKHDRTCNADGECSTGRRTVLGPTFGQEKFSRPRPNPPPWSGTGSRILTVLRSLTQSAGPAAMHDATCLPPIGIHRAESVRQLPVGKDLEPLIDLNRPRRNRNAERANLCVRCGAELKRRADRNCHAGSGLQLDDLLPAAFAPPHLPGPGNDVPDFTDRPMPACLGDITRGKPKVGRTRRWEQGQQPDLRTIRRDRIRIFRQSPGVKSVSLVFRCH